MDSFLVIFKKFLESRNLLFTKERQEVMSEALRIKGHFEADELYLRLRMGKKHVSKASVYRTLPLLLEAGLLRQVEFVHRHMHYENTKKKEYHYHLICKTCGKVIEFRRPSVERMLESVARGYCFEKICHKVEIIGFCKVCRQLERQGKRGSDRRMRLTHDRK